MAWTNGRNNSSLKSQLVQLSMFLERTRWKSCYFWTEPRHAWSETIHCRSRCMQHHKGICNGRKKRIRLFSSLDHVRPLWVRFGTKRRFRGSHPEAQQQKKDRLRKYRIVDSEKHQTEHGWTYRSVDSEVHIQRHSNKRRNTADNIEAYIQNFTYRGTST